MKTWCERCRRWFTESWCPLCGDTRNEEDFNEDINPNIREDEDR